MKRAIYIFSSVYLCHLALLLHVFRIRSSDNTSTTSLTLHPRSLMSAVPKMERLQGCYAAFNFISRLARCLPFFIDDSNDGCQEVWRIRLARKPIQDNRLRSYTHSWCSSGEVRGWGCWQRLMREGSAHSKESQTPDDPWMPARKFGLVRGCPPIDW